MNALQPLEDFLAAQGEVLLDWQYKGFAALREPVRIADLQREGLELSALGTPMMTVDVSAVAANLLAMARWCQDRGVALAPHGKTTMAPVLWLGQLLAGCTAITVANGSQLRAAREFGVPSIHLASELVDPRDIAWIGEELRRDPQLAFCGWVDSVEGVRRMTAANATGAPINVCVEVGAAGGRTGARSLEEVLAVARAVAASPALSLAGVSAYEGAVPDAATTPAGLAAVDAFLHQVAQAHRSLAPLYETERVIVTAGGSAYFDRVAAVLAPLAEDPRVDVVLRSGAYVVHDDLHYRAITPSTRGDGPELRSAIHVWAAVLSRPEPGLVILDAGRRDLPFDLDLPIVVGTRGGVPLDVGRTEVVALNDQHAFVRVPPDATLAVGDVLKLGLSHPCTAFDKWRAIAMVESADVPLPRVSDVALTYF